MAMVKAISEQSPTYGGFVHFGATSQDVNDSVLALQMTECKARRRRRLPAAPWEQRGKRGLQRAGAHRQRARAPRRQARPYRPRRVQATLLEATRAVRRELTRLAEQQAGVNALLQGALAESADAVGAALEATLPSSRRG